MRIFDAAETARLLPYQALVDSLAGVLVEYERGEIVSPERLVVSCGSGRGLLLSMPCHAADLVVHKLLTIYAGNPAAGLPAIQGQVSCFRAEDGVPLIGLDGPTVTARRTAAVTMVGIRQLRPSPPKGVLLIGTGAQARAHVEALLDLYPEVLVGVRARSDAAAAAFCAVWPDRVSPATARSEEAAEVVVAVTSATTPVYDEPPHAGRLVVGVGAYRLDMIEIGARTISGSVVYVDDPVGAPAEAGDIVAAGTDWSSVRTLASSLDAPPDLTRPVFLKSVGCAAWDLAACRAALRALEAS